MSKSTNLVVAGSLPTSAAVLSAGAVCCLEPRPESSEASSTTALPYAGLNKPTVFYWHGWTDENGGSHQDRCELSAFNLQSISQWAAPSWIDTQNTPGATVLVVVQPVGWVGEWHENPKPQRIVPLSGRWFVETMDGKRVEMGPGELSFGGDQNFKPDSQGRKGHRSGTMGDQPSVNLIVQLEKTPSAGQHCGFE